MDEKNIAKLGKEIGALMRQHVSDRLAPLEARIAELELRPQVKYFGVWNPAEQYRPGSFVTHGGSVWHADVGSTGVAPGDGMAWRLAVKKGRDAR